MATRRERFGLMVPPPLWYIAGLVTGWLLSRIFPARFAMSLTQSAVGALCFVIGLIFVAPAVASFARAKTSLVPTRPTNALVETGPYRFTRNPMYVGLAFVYLGVALLTDWLWAVVVLPFILAIVYVAAIGPEERFLEEKFGEAYVAYRARVHRWL